MKSPLKQAQPQGPRGHQELQCQLLSSAAAIQVGPKEALMWGLGLGPVAPASAYYKVTEEPHRNVPGNGPQARFLRHPNHSLS